MLDAKSVMKLRYMIRRLLLVMAGQFYIMVHKCKGVQSKSDIVKNP